MSLTPLVGVLATYKHFPGHGATAGDTHAGYAYSNCTLEELKSCELIPFEAGIKAGISFVMVGHISFPNILGDDTPASLSQYIIVDVILMPEDFKSAYQGVIDAYP